MTFILTQLWQLFLAMCGSIARRGSSYYEFTKMVGIKL